MTRLNYTSFNRWLIGILLSVLLALAAFNVFNDPYGVWMVRRIPGVTSLKPLMDEKGRLRIAWEIRRTRPKALVFGTSTAKQLSYIDYGKAVDERACNAGAAMASLSEVRAFLDLALAQQPEVDHVLLALDFFQFNDLGYMGMEKDTAFTRMPVMARDGAALLLSGVGTKASTETLVQNLRAPRPARPVVAPGASHANSSSVATGSAVATPTTQATSSVAVVATSSGASSAPSSVVGAPVSGVDRVALFNKNLERDMAKGGINVPYRASERALEDLQAIVNTCREHDIDLRVVITPIHARHMDELYLAGLGPEYEAWVRRVSTITPVWDFSGYNEITTEPVTQGMKWFMDPLHYSLATGTVMIERIYGRPTSTEGFGTLVTQSTIEEHLSELRRQYDERAARVGTQVGAGAQ